MSWVAQSVNGCVPEHITPRLRSPADFCTSRTVSTRSALASATVWQIPVTTSIVDSSSSCLALGFGSSGSTISARISEAPDLRCRVSRSMSSSSHSTPRLVRSDGLNRMLTTPPPAGECAQTAPDYPERNLAGTVRCQRKGLEGQEKTSQARRQGGSPPPTFPQHRQERAVSEECGPAGRQKRSEGW